MRVAFIGTPLPSFERGQVEAFDKGLLVRTAAMRLAMPSKTREASTSRSITSKEGSLYGGVLNGKSVRPNIC